MSLQFVLISISFVYTFLINRLPIYDTNKESQEHEYSNDLARVSQLANGFISLDVSKLHGDIINNMENNEQKGHIGLSNAMEQCGAQSNRGWGITRGVKYLNGNVMDHHYEIYDKALMKYKRHIKAEVFQHLRIPDGLFTPIEKMMLGLDYIDDPQVRNSKLSTSQSVFFDQSFYVKKR